MFGPWRLYHEPLHVPVLRPSSQFSPWVHVEQGGSHKGVMTQWELLVIHCVCGGRIRTFFRLGCDSVTEFAAVVWFVS